ncbi:MAG: D-tyrosyl-tRNA(Tyr) deacylase [Elusimicrobia bacterium]|nr:D-tyrosyl-tRNA(Tyr) deacylase [Elusimicrobiota bacterium]
MRALIQRVSRACVRFPELSGTPERSIGRGLLVLVGCGAGDGAGTADQLARKCAGLRIFADESGRFSLGLAEVRGAVLAVSQFTLYGDCRKGRRPDFLAALPGPQAEPLYRRFVETLRSEGVPVETGEFGAKMEVELVNDGPVTLWLDSAGL